MYNVNDDVLKVLFSEEEIDKRCKELAKEIEKDYEDLNPLFICVLKGALPFFSKIVLNLSIPMEYDCIKVKSYIGTKSSGVVTIDSFDFKSVKNRHVIIVEDIIDSGLTMDTISKIFLEHEVKSLQILTLLNKPVINRIPLNIKYIGFTMPDEFVIGFGLDYNGKYRNLPYIGVIKPEKVN